jgi:hypothetical protein
MVFEDENSEEVCEFRLDLKELFDSAGITGNQLVTMTLNLLTGKARARFQNIDCEKTAKNAELDHRLNELELFYIVLDDWVETFLLQHTSNKSSSDYFAKQKNISCMTAKCHQTCRFVNITNACTVFPHLWNSFLSVKMELPPLL